VCGETRARIVRVLQIQERYRGGRHCNHGWRRIEQVLNRCPMLLLLKNIRKMLRSGDCGVAVGAPTCDNNALACES
jgi:hypothetical protein